MEDILPRITPRYQILAPLGQGGMGVVYRAHDRLTSQEVALKRVALGTTGSPHLAVCYNRRYGAIEPIQ